MGSQGKSHLPHTSFHHYLPALKIKWLCECGGWSWPGGVVEIWSTIIEILNLEFQIQGFSSWSMYHLPMHPCLKYVLWSPWKLHEHQKWWPHRPANESRNPSLANMCLHDDWFLQWNTNSSLYWALCAVSVTYIIIYLSVSVRNLHWHPILWILKQTWRVTC